jgi:purine-binding chemotaxis protein CheW
MDILAARKKAAERARAEKQEAVSLEENAPAIQAVASAPAERTVTIIDEGPAAVPVNKTAAPQTEEPRPGIGPVADALPAQEPAAEIEMLSFMLSNEEYIVPVSQVNEVLKVWNLTMVPNAPDYILGVSSLRGTMLTVLDLCTRLGLSVTERGDRSRVIVATVNDEKIGLIVDRVTGVVKLSLDAVRAVPETVEKGVEFLRGIARKDERLFILLDLDKAVAG